MSEPRLKSVLCSSPAGLHRMAYKEWGDPANTKVLVCVHGVTRVGDDFDALARALSDRYRVVCPDVVGRGRSGRVLSHRARNRKGRKNRGRAGGWPEVGGPNPADSGADALAGQRLGLVREGGAAGPHLVQNHPRAGFRRLESGFRAGQAAADDMNGSHDRAFSRETSLRHMTKFLILAGYQLFMGADLS